MRATLLASMILVVVPIGLSRAASGQPGTQSLLHTVKSFNQHSADIDSLGTVTATTVSVTARVDGQLTSLTEGQPVRAGQVIGSITREGTADASAEHVVALVAPVSGLVSFPTVDVGNHVHRGETLLTIAEVQPIAVLFTIPEDAMPRVQALLRNGVAPSVEIWNRTFSALLANGRVTETDNHIDASSATVKLKAIVDNKNAVLFPNQFVNVRLLLRDLD